MSETLIEVQDLVKHFPVQHSKLPLIAVNGVTLTFTKGRTLGLVGESGSGKSTVGRCLLRLIDPTAGRILYQGTELTQIPKDKFRQLWRARMQMVFQDPFDSLNPRMSIRDTILEPLMLSRKLNGNGQRKATELLERVRLDPALIGAYRHQLTPGQQQRVGIARAIATNPEFIVLDEPTSLLDLSVRAEILKLLALIQNELQLTYLFISHDLSTVKHICHDVAVMYLGRVIETGSVEQVFNNPLHPYSKALLSSVLHPDPAKPRSVFQLSGEIPSPLDQPQGCPLHTRCPAAVDACRQTPQHYFDVGGGHLVACMRIEDGTLAY
jgi:oligopeptide/dipeptide ABC transporter ATP-binding protein